MGALNTSAKRYLLFVSRGYAYEILRPLQSAIRARGDDVAWYVHGAHTALHAGEKLLRSVDDVKRFDPIAVFVPGNWVPDFFPGVKVELFHGFGIEKRGHFAVRGLFDLYCTHGPATTGPFKALAHRYGYFRVAETGWPKMDPLFNLPRAQDYRARHGIASPVILYAPTFSPRLTSAPHLVDSIGALARTGPWHWLVKFHPNMDVSTMDAYRALRGPNLSIAEDEQLLPLLHAADAMVSDTSSVVAEFLMLDKPVVTFRAKQPGEHVINVIDSTHLEEAISSALQRPPALIKAAREFIGQMHPYRDGKSSERVLTATDEFVTQYAGRLKSKPYNLWRKLQIRRRMNHYRIA